MDTKYWVSLTLRPKCDQLGMMWHGTITLNVPCNPKSPRYTWWRHRMETFSAPLVLCEGNLPVTGGFPSPRPVTWSLSVFFGQHLNKWLSKQSRRRWFETPSCSLWRHCNENWLSFYIWIMYRYYYTLCQLWYEFYIPTFACGGYRGRTRNATPFRPIDISRSIIVRRFHWPMQLEFIRSCWIGDVGWMLKRLWDSESTNLFIILVIRKLKAHLSMLSERGAVDQYSRGNLSKRNTTVERFRSTEESLEEHMFWHQIHCGLMSWFTT